MIESGRLRHRVTIESPIDDQDSNGAPIAAWEEVKTVWAAIEPLSAREFIAAQASQSKVSGRIAIRYFAGLDASMRIVHGQKIYNIEGILPDADSGLEYITFPVSQGVRNDEAG